MPSNPLLTFARVFEANALASPDEPAILAPGRLTLTNRRLYEQVVATRDALNRLGIGRHDRVALVARGGADVVSAFASVSCAATCAVLNPAYKRDEFEAMFTQMRIDALIYQEMPDSPVLGAARTCNLFTIQMLPSPDVACGRFTLCGDPRGRTIQRGFAEPDDIAMLLPTSGTTGVSKIVPLTHRMMIERLGPNLGADAFPKGRLLHVMPMFHYSGQGYLIRTLAVGAGAVCLPGFEIDSFFAALDEFKPSAFGGAATMLQSIVSHAASYRDIIQQHTLRYIRADGMALPPDLKHELEHIFGVPVMQLYASTETGIISRSPLMLGASKPGSVGKLFHIDAQIVDEADQPLPAPQSGEIVVRGGAVIQAYDDNPSATAEAIRGGWYHTGDLGYFDDDGELFIIGRVKEVINRGGQKISPVEVERVLLTHPDVEDAAVFGLPDAQLGEEIGAALILRAGASIPLDQLRRFAGARLADYKLPRHIFFVSSIPRTSIGKVERYKLTAQCKAAVSIEPIATLAYTAPQTPLETDIVAIWAAVLNKPSALIGTRDEFQALGGTSLSAARIVFKMREHFQLDIRLHDLFDAPTIQQQTAVIARLQANRATLDRASITLIPIRAEGSRPPLYCLHALEGGTYLYRDLAVYLDPEQPVYGLQAVGLDDGKPPLDSIDAMCTHHLAQIEAVQPNGPYLLLGYSMGGRLALEIGRRLRAKGHRAVHVMMIDSHMQTNAYRASGSTPPRWAQGRYLNRVYNFLFAMFRLPMRYKAIYLRERWLHLRKLLQGQPNRANPPEKFDIASAPTTVQKVMEAADRAAKAYIPSPYAGDITYLRAAGDIVNIPMFRALYYQAAGSLTVIDVPGTHYDVLREPNIQSVAAEIRNWLISLEVPHEP